MRLTISIYVGWLIYGVVRRSQHCFGYIDATSALIDTFPEFLLPVRRIILF